MGNLAGLFGKLLTVLFFAGILYFLIDYILGRIADYMATMDVAVNILYFMCKLGVFEALNVFFSLLIAAWFSNKILNYLSN